MVSAYKSLLKEKEALDHSLKAFTSEKPAETSTSADHEHATLNALAILNAEKSRCEKQFMAEKKQLTTQIKELKLSKDQLSDQLKSLQLSLDTSKSKLINYDRILSDERHLKETLEFQLNQLKTQFITAQSGPSSDLNQENLELRKKIKAHESNSCAQDSSLVIQALQIEIDSLKQQHVARSQIEQQKANEASEKSKNLTALHEKQVQDLEEKLSELSLSVSYYHKLREEDQEQITNLKEVIFQLNRSTKRASSVAASETKVQHEDVLLKESSRLEVPLNVTVISSLNSSTDAGLLSSEKYIESEQLCNRLKCDNEVLVAEIEEKSLHIKTLQEKVSVLNKNIDEYEQEIKRKSIELNERIRLERVNYKESINLLEMAHRSKISQLEQQIQKQRDRSLALLEEKENELRSLKTSYELFMPKKNPPSRAYDDDDQMSSTSDSRRTSTSQHLGIVLNQASSSSNLPETHMIYYSNELAR